MRDNPLILTDCAVKRPKAKTARSKYTKSTSATSPLEATEQKSDLLIRDLYQNDTDSFHNMSVVNTDTKSHSAKTPEKCLQKVEWDRNKIYLEARLQQLRHFSPFVSSVDGMLGLEMTATLKTIAIRHTSKWRQPYSRTCGYVKSRIYITLVRAKYRCIRGFRVLAQKISVQRSQWEDKSRLNLFK